MCCITRRANSVPRNQGRCAANKRLLRNKFFRGEETLTRIVPVKSTRAERSLQAAVRLIQMDTDAARADGFAVLAPVWRYAID